MRYRLTVIFGLIVPAICFAADQAACRPAVDLSSPKAAVVSAYQMLKAGDVTSARQCMFFSNPSQAEAFDLTITPLWYPLALMHAMEAKFGESARDLFSAASLEKNADQAIEEVGRCTVEITPPPGDTASLIDKKAAVDPSKETQVTGIQFKKVGEQWKVVASSFPEMPGEIPPQDAAMMRAARDSVVNAVQSVASRVDKGEFKTAEAAFKAYQAAVQETSKPPTKR